MISRVVHHLSYNKVVRSVAMPKSQKELILARNATPRLEPVRLHQVVSLTIESSLSPTPIVNVISSSQNG